jgi:cellulose synthase/poly-beta-1,6-N-acetylglucosamine synthase-like glycosyltransferase
VNTDASGVASPLVSVVVPTFNRTRLADALASALQQTYPATEILVADDARRADRAGSGVTPVVEVIGALWGFAVDDMNVYWASYSNGGALSR